MVEEDIILAKISIIQRCLERVKEATGSNPDSLEDMDVQDIFVLNLQRAIQAVIDIAAHIVGTEGWKLPDTFKGNFRLLHQKKIIDQNLSDRMQKMVGFRNIAVHDYQNIDIDILKSILQKNLIDLETFYGTIIKHYKLDIVS